jgi:hypothetical protein
MARNGQEQKRSAGDTYRISVRTVPSASDNMDRSGCECPLLRLWRRGTVSKLAFCQTR